MIQVIKSWYVKADYSSSCLG